MKNNNENTRKDQYENKENIEISNDSPRVLSTDVVPSPRVIFPNKLPVIIDKSTNKCKLPPNQTNSLLKPLEYLKAPIMPHSSDSIVTRT